MHYMYIAQSIQQLDDKWIDVTHNAMPTVPKAHKAVSGFVDEKGKTAVSACIILGEYKTANTGAAEERQ